MVAGTWTEKAASGTLTTGEDPTQFVVGNFAYILSTFNNNLYAYDSVNDTWSVKATFPPRDRCNAGGFTIGTKGYICCGYVAFPSPYFIDDLWEYDTVNNSWLQKADFPGDAREGVVAFGHTTTGFCGLGYKHYTNLLDFYRYNQSSNTWTTMGNGPSLRNPQCANNSTHGYTVFNNSVKKWLWEYNKSTDIWTQKTDYSSTARRHAACFITHNILFAGSGIDSGSNLLYDWYGYDLTTNTWSVTTSLGVSKSRVNYWSISDIGYVLNGYSNTNWAFEAITTFTLSGTISDEFGNPIRDADITISNGTTYTTTTDENGAYSQVVDADTYDIAVSKSRSTFHDITESSVAVTADTTQDITMLTDKVLGIQNAIKGISIPGGISMGRSRR